MRPWLVQVLVLALAAAQMAFYYARLPDRVPSDFDLRGVAAGWMSRAGFLATYIAVAAIIVVACHLLPRWIGKLPSAGLHMANRTTWLAPERRQRTLAAIERQLGWIGVCTQAFVVVVMQLVMNAALSGGERVSMPILWTVLVLYLVAIFRLALRLVSKFSTPAAAGPG